MATGARAVTIIDVANAAGVSRQTVTRALNGLPDISVATRARVVEAARVLNYRPNRAAQGLVRGHGVTIGLVVENLRNPYFPELASAITRAADDRGWSVLLCDVGDDEAAVARVRPVLDRVDALVGHIPLDHHARTVLAIPTVMIDGSADDPVGALIELDHRGGVRAALDHLVATGRTRIAMIDAGHEVSARCLVYREYLREHGLRWSEESEIRGEETHGGGIRASAELVERYPDADAVLVFNDVIAVGALKGFARVGVAVPGRIAVIGIDGLAIGALVTPELTTLSIDKAELARHAMELVDDLLAARPAESSAVPARRLLGYTLVVRESA